MENRLRPEKRVIFVLALLAVLVISWATLAKNQDASQTSAQTEAAQRQAPQVKEREWRNDGYAGGHHKQSLV